jgi:hypothetical protein
MRKDKKEKKKKKKKWNVLKHFNDMHKCSSAATGEGGRMWIRKKKKKSEKSEWPLKRLRLDSVAKVDIFTW